MTLPRTKHLLGYFTTWTIDTSVSGISYSETLRNALRTGYQRLSQTTNSKVKHILLRVKYAIGEVLGGGISKDDRGSVVLQKRKGPKYLDCRNRLQERSYSTRSKKGKLANVVEPSKDFLTLAKHWWVCHNNRVKIFNDLGGLLKLESIWFAAYKKLKKNKGSKTAGPDAMKIDSITECRILELRDAVLKGNYQWGGIRQINIPKPGKPGKTRPLGIPTINDRLVQEVIRTIIEPIFELDFNDQSHGFRPSRSCHTALKWAYTNMKSMTWFIEGDIKSYFPTINHNILINLINKRIGDPKILKLIKSGLKARIFLKDGETFIPKLGTPQGGILSPLLSNIYLHELDKFMEELAKKYDAQRGSARKKRNPVALKLLNQNKKSELYAKRISFYVHDDNQYVKVRYIRYADDFIVGVTGSRGLAVQIRQQIKEFLDHELKVELSIEKTRITHISKGIPFLGYILSRRTLIIKQRYHGKRKHRKMTIPLLSVDMNRVIERLNTAGYCDKSGKPKPAWGYLQYPQSQTNRMINYILRGLSEWWKIAGNRKRATAWLVYILKTSIAKMYAAKFKLDTVATTFKIGGKDLGLPIGKRAKSVVGNDENQTPKGTVLQGIMYCKYNEIPDTAKNMIKANWKPEYIKYL